MIRRTLKLALIFLCWIATLTFAGEGRIPIWEPVVIAAPSSSQGKYIVTRDVVGGGGATLDVVGSPGTLEEVEIDLNGFTIFGGTSVSPVIRATVLQSLTIRNGSIRAVNPSSTGIAIAGVEKVVIEDVKIAQGYDGISLREVENFSLRRNVIVDAGSDSIHVDSGIVTVAITGTIEDNLVQRSGRSGIVVGLNHSAVTIRNNRIETAGRDGIEIGGGDGFLILENTVQDATDLGIGISGGKSCKIANNVVTGSAGDGVALFGTVDCLLLDNVSSDNAGNGIQICGRRNLIDRSVVGNNGLAGLFFCTLAQDNAFGRNLGRGNSGFPGACLNLGAPTCVPPPDYCDDDATGSNSSFGDNFLPHGC